MPGIDLSAASLDVWVMKPILEAKGIASVREFTELQTVYNRDSREFVMTLSRSLQHRLEALVVLRIDRQRYVHVRSAEWIFPVGGSVITDIIQNGRARRHALTEFLGETIQRCLRHSQCLETLITE